MSKYTSWVDLISDKTNEIKYETNTIFRQNSKPLGKLDINYVLTGKNWIDGLYSKEAMVTFSKSSHHLIIIPKIIVDKHIFHPLFKKYADEYEFRLSFQNYEHRGRSIRIKYREDSGSLVVTLCTGIKKKAKEIDLLLLPYYYYEKINILSDEPLSEFIKIVIDRIKKLSDGKGVAILESIVF